MWGTNLPTARKVGSGASATTSSSEGEVDAVEHDADAVRGHAQVDERLGARGGDRGVQRGGVGQGHGPALEGAPEGGDRGREPLRPVVGVDVVDEADGRLAPPQWRVERHAVGDVDHEVGPALVAQVVDGGPQVLRELPPAVAHPVGVVGDGPPGPELDPVAPTGQAAGQLVDHHLAAAGEGVAGVPPGVDGDVERSRTGRVHRSPLSCGALLSAGPVPGPPSRRTAARL